MVSRLCPACGLCCNGVLFGDVELQPGDDANHLETLGMDLFVKGRKQRFNQPCACFDGKLCRIYDDRPSRCRSFECRLLQRTQSGQLTVTYALKAMEEARRSADVVRKLLRELGQTDERVPLSRRYAAAMAEPIDLAHGNGKVQRRSALMLAVFRLTRVLERDFLC
jgi:uncharacterized protein